MPIVPFAERAPVIVILFADAVPLIWTLFPLSVAVPIRTLPPNSANDIVPSAFTSIEGIPETSFTEKIVPVRSFVIENNWPAEPSKLNVPFDVGSALSVIVCPVVELSAPTNSILGSAVVDPLFGVINMFLSAFDIKRIPCCAYCIYNP